MTRLHLETGPDHNNQKHHEQTYVCGLDGSALIMKTVNMTNTV